MGYFDSVQPAAAAPAPLTDERVVEALTRLELNPEIDEQGMAVVHFPKGYFYPMLTDLPTGSLLSVRGNYRGSFTFEQAGTLAQYVNYWNAQNVFPKVFIHIEGEEGDEALFLPTELSMVYAGGVTDAQLEEHIKAAVQTSLEFFENLEAIFKAEGGQ